jgi:hypothetical protein
LQSQAKLLEKTLPTLREFIASNFTIPDILGYGKRSSKALEPLTGTADFNHELGSEK